MSWRYAFVFTLLALVCALFGIGAVGPTRGVSLAFLYPAVSFGLVAVGYAGVGPRVFGKGRDGRRRWWARVLLAPYLLLTRFSFLVYRLGTRHPVVSEVSPGLLLGRRLQPGEAGLAGGGAVLDLAAEFTELPALRTRPHYLSLPLLDATAPAAEHLRQAVGWVAERLAAGPVFVHCALGHGRSACVVIACLLHLGRVASVRDGLRLVRQHRPGVGLHPPQRSVLREWEGRIPPPST